MEDAQNEFVNESEQKPDQDKGLDVGSGEPSDTAEESSCGSPGNADSPHDSGKVAALEAEVADFKNRYLRLMADFDNYKKRALKEQSELLRYQGEKVITDLLEVLDNLELALSHSSAEFDKLKTGLEMVQKLFVERLAKWEVKGESALGNQFDPQKHSAISRVPGADALPGTVVGELKKAYFYKDKLIRFGEVVVATEKEQA